MFRIAILLFIIPIRAFCCTCAEPYYFNFLDASEHPVFKNNFEFIVQAKIISYSPDYYFMEVGIIEGIKDSFSKDTVIISGQDGMNCAFPFQRDLFDVSDTVILRLTNDFYNREDTLELSDCSINYLLYEDGYVKGSISKMDTLLSYQEFKYFYESPIISSTEAPVEHEHAMVYPNPASGTLYVDYDAHKSLFICILDLSGRICKCIRSFSPGYIDISGLEEGVYFLKVIDSFGTRLQTQKIIIKQ